MGFYLYTQNTEADKQNFIQIKKISLAGNINGIIPKYFKTQVNTGIKKEIAWYVSGNDLIKNLKELDNGNAILIDWNPAKETQNSLLLLEKLWGYTYENWSVFLVQLKDLYRDPIKSTKENFRLIGNESAETSFTFWYMTGGYSSGKWGWPGPSSNNSAFLYRDALKYFTQILNENINQK
jgi:hypothetical protein